MVTRSRLPISVLFRLAPGDLQYPYHPLQIRLAVNGSSYSSISNLPVRLLRKCDALPKDRKGYGLFVVNPDVWDKKAYRRKDRSREAILFNGFISQITSELTEIYFRQDEAGLTPTKATVWNEFKNGAKSNAMPVAPKPVVKIEHGWTVLDAMGELVEQKRKLHKLGDVAKSTLLHYEQTLIYISRYLEDRPSFQVEDFTGGIALDFHIWLRQTGPMSKTQATRYMERLCKAFDELLQDRKIKLNPIAGKKWPRDGRKKVVYLNKAQVEELLSITDHSGEQSYLYWAKLMILTGMDHPDIERYMKNRAEFEHDTPKGRVIKIRRSKKPHGLCVIPIDRHPYSQVLISLIEQRPPKWLKVNTVTKSLIALGKKMGLDFSFNTKVCRKTAGTTVFLAHFSLQATSRMLGHSSIAMTETHYGKTTEDTVLNEL